MCDVLSSFCSVSLTFSLYVSDVNSVVYIAVGTMPVVHLVINVAQFFFN